MQSGDVFEGLVVLNNVTTGEPVHVAVFISCGDDEITYTAQSIDRRVSETLTAPKWACPFFLEVMQTVAQVGRRDVEPSHRG